MHRYNTEQSSSQLDQSEQHGGEERVDRGSELLEDADRVRLKGCHAREVTEKEGGGH